MTSTLVLAGNFAANSFFLFFFFFFFFFFENFEEKELKDGMLFLVDGLNMPLDN